MHRFVQVAVILILADEALKIDAIRFSSKELQCYNVNPKIFVLETCSVEFGNKTNSKLNFVAKLVKPIRSTCDRFQTYYKNGTEEFQPSVIDTEFNICDMFRIFKVKHPMYELLKVVEVLMPHLKQGCPLKGVINITNFETEREIPKYYPGNVVTGTYMGKNRIYDCNTEVTFIEVTYVFDVE